MEKRTYQFQKSKLHLIFGDITNSNSNVIVSSDDTDLSMGGGVSYAILNAAGEALLVNAAKRAPVAVGDVAITTAGALPAHHIFHVATLNRQNREISFSAHTSITKCLNILNTLGLKSISFSSLGTGVAGHDLNEIATTMAQVITDYIRSNDSDIDVSIYLYDRFEVKTKIDYIAFFEQFAMRVGGSIINSNQQSSVYVELTERASSAQHLSELTLERDKIEKKLIGLPATSTARSDLESKLSEINTKRISILKDLSSNAKPSAVKLFISYSHEDSSFFDEFKAQLKSLELSYLIQGWHDRKIYAGTEWEQQIDDNLQSANVIVFLISSSFISSSYCHDIEMAKALERHRNSSALVIPILIRSVGAWQDLPLKIQALPPEGKAVSVWGNRDLAWTNVIDGIKSAIIEFNTKL